MHLKQTGKKVEDKDKTPREKVEDWGNTEGGEGKKNSTCSVMFL